MGWNCRTPHPAICARRSPHALEKNLSTVKTKSSLVVVSFPLLTTLPSPTPCGYHFSGSDTCTSRRPSCPQASVRYQLQHSAQQPEHRALTLSTSASLAVHRTCHAQTCPRSSRPCRTPSARSCTRSISTCCCSTVEHRRLKRLHLRTRRALAKASAAATAIRPPLCNLQHFLQQPCTAPTAPTPKITWTLLGNLVPTTVYPQTVSLTHLDPHPSLQSPNRTYRLGIVPTVWFLLRTLVYLE